MKQHPTVLGISPGTRYMGIAIAKNGELLDWRVKNFKGVWSEKKLHAIMISLRTIVRKYRVSQIALKIPLHKIEFKGSDELMSELLKYAESMNLRVSLYSLQLLKDLYCGDEKASIDQLIESVAIKQPELFFEHAKEQKNLNPYHVAMFEAAASASHASESKPIQT